MQRLRTVTLLDVSAVAGHHAMPAALLLYVMGKELSGKLSCVRTDLVITLSLTLDSGDLCTVQNVFFSCCSPYVDSCH